MNASGPARALIHDRSSDLGRARSRADDLTRVLDHARASDLALGRDTILDVRVLDRASALTLDTGPSAGFDLDRAHGRACDLAPALDRVLDRARALEDTINRACALTRENAPFSAFYSDGGRSHALAIDRRHARDLTRDLSRARDLTRDLIRDLGRAATGVRETERVMPLAGHLCSAAARLLPAGDRARWAEEYQSEIWEIARDGTRRRAQLAYAARQLMAAPRLRAGLRASRRRGAVPR